jgi:hypothetical protein
MPNRLACSFHGRRGRLPVEWLPFAWRVWPWRISALARWREKTQGLNVADGRSNLDVYWHAKCSIADYRSCCVQQQGGASGAWLVSSLVVVPLVSSVPTTRAGVKLQNPAR